MTSQLADYKGCFHRALPDEPVFTLLGRDPCAPEVIRYWVTCRQALIGKGEKPMEDHEILAEAIRLAQAAAIWRSDATDPANGYSKAEPRWHREQPGIGYKTLLEEAAGLFFDYAQQHYQKDTAEGDRKGDRNREMANAIYKFLGLPLMPPRRPRSHTEEEGGIQLPYDEWIKVYESPNTMRLGNRFLLWDHNSELVFAENRNYRKPGTTAEDWTGYYPVRHSLQKEMLWCAYEDFVNRTRPEIKTQVKLSLSADASDMTNAFVKAGNGILMLKIMLGMQQVARDLHRYVEGRPWPNKVKNEMFTFCDRLNGYAREISEEAPFGDGTDGERLENLIVDAIKEHGGEFKRLLFADVADLKSRPAYSGLTHDPALDRRDVTEIDTPEMPPHRFAMFDKGKGWAYGRGLEINPAHIPAMLDRMEEDGYTLVAALGAQADKVGMIFQRGPRYSAFELAHGFGAPVPETGDSPAMADYKAGKPFHDWPDAPLPTGSDAIDTSEFEDPNRLPQFLGTMGPWGVWVAAQMPEDMRACIRTAIASVPCGAGGLGRGLEP